MLTKSILINLGAGQQSAERQISQIKEDELPKNNPNFSDRKVRELAFIEYPIELGLLLELHESFEVFPVNIFLVLFFNSVDEFIIVFNFILIVAQQPLYDFQ